MGPNQLFSGTLGKNISRPAAQHAQGKKLKTFVLLRLCVRFFLVLACPD